MKAVLVFIIMLIAIPVFAQDRVGNGGGLWACKAADQTLSLGMLVDLFEARSEFGLPLLKPVTTDPLAIVQERAQFLNNNWLDMYLLWKPVLDSVVNSWQLVDGPLTKISDSFIRTTPGANDPCATPWEYTQFANFTNVGPLLISKELWESPQVPAMDKAALIWHEVIYRWLRETQSEKDSIRTRAAIGYLFSDLPPNEIKEKISDEIKPVNDPAKQLKIDLLKPFDGETVSGNISVQFKAKGEPDFTPAVFVYVDEGVLIGRIPTAPYQLLLDTKKLRNGRHQLYGVLYGVSATVDSNKIYIHVKN